MEDNQEKENTETNSEKNFLNNKINDINIAFSYTF